MPVEAPNLLGEQLAAFSFRIYLESNYLSFLENYD